MKKVIAAAIALLVLAALPLTPQVQHVFVATDTANIFSAVNTFNAGLVSTSVTDSGLTSGNCLQASTGGLLATIATPCPTNTAVTPGTYTFATVTVNQLGQITSASSGSPSTGTVTSVAAGTGLTASPSPITTTGTISLNAQYTKLRCETGLGDGVNAMSAASYLQSMCYNDSGVTWTITGIKCFTDNNGTSTLAATNGGGTALLSPATVTCTNSWAAGSQSATTTIANGDFIKFTFAADGSSKQTTWVVSMTQ